MPLYPDAPGSMSYSAGLADMSPLGNLATDFFQGAENKRKYDVARTFKGGLPRDEAGNIDFNRAAEWLATRGDASQLVPLANVDLQRKFLGGALSDSSTAFPTGPQASAAPSGSYPERTAAVESGGNVAAKNPNSTAAGPHQFTDATWLENFDKAFPQAAGSPAENKLALRTATGPQAKAVQDRVMQTFTAGNEAALRAAGVPVNDTTRYGAHFFGAGDAPKVFKAPAETPLASIVQPETLAANPFLQGMTAGQARVWLAQKMPAGEGGASSFAAPEAPAAPAIPPHGIPQGSADGSPPAAAPVRVAGPAMAAASSPSAAPGPAAAPPPVEGAPQAAVSPQATPPAQQSGTMPAALRPLIPQKFSDPMQYVNFLRQKQASYEAAGLAGIKGADGAAKAYGAQADKIMDAIGKYYELTPEQKNAMASGGLNPLQFENAKVVGRVLAENSALTPEQKLYDQAKRQGFVGTELDFQAERERLKQEGKVSAENSALTPEQKNYRSDALPGESMAEYQARVAGLKSAAEPTPEMKNAAADRRPGESLAEYQSRVAGGKKYAEDEASRFGKKYDAISKAGQEASVELPQLQLAKSILNDPKFYSGPAEGLNLGYKRILATIDPTQADAAQPQEAFRKVVSNSILSQIRSLAGTGQIRVAEIRIMEKAAANQENTPAANRLLVDIATRLHQHALGLDEIARNYNGGRLDPGFDTVARKWTEAHPLFTPAELKDPRLIAPPIFNTPEEVKKAGLGKGAPFQTPDGRIKYVP